MRFSNLLLSVAAITVVTPLAAEVAGPYTGTPQANFSFANWTLNSSEYISGVKTGTVYVAYYKNTVGGFPAWAAYIPMVNRTYLAFSKADLHNYIVANFDSWIN